MIDDSQNLYSFKSDSLRDLTIPTRAPAVVGIRQQVRYEERPSDSPLIERVWQTHSDVDDECIAIADGRWDMMFFQQGGRATVMLTGAQTSAIRIPHVAGSGWLGIRFRLGVQMPLFALNTLVNEGVTLPGASGDSFWLHGAAWELPSYHNAEVFINRLVRDSLLTPDPVVQAALAGADPAYSARALQYRFQQSIGLTQKTVQQIERAQHAVALLEANTPILETALQLGYYDQAHLTNALTRFIGRTPAQIARR